MLTVNVRVFGEPTPVPPKSTAPVPAGTAVAPSTTWACGSVAVASPIRSIRTASATRHAAGGQVAQPHRQRPAREIEGAPNGCHDAPPSTRPEGADRWSTVAEPSVVEPSSTA